MKTNILFVGLIALLAACGSEQSINVSNGSSVKLVQKSVEMERSVLEKSLGALPEGETALLVSSDGANFPAQLDDIDNDGKWDQLFTQMDLDAGEILSLTIDFVPQTMPVKTNIRFADKNDASKEFTRAERLKTTDTNVTQKVFQFEGPGWENDVAGFRNYFDERNGMDIFGKTTRDMALDGCGLKDGPSYHELQAWGMDILKVGNSLGAGAIALETATGLHRIGPGGKGTYVLIKEGPLRSIFDLDFEGIEIDGQTVKVKHRISIEAGKPYYKSQVWVDGIEDAKLVTGIVNLHADSVYNQSNEKFSYFYTHDNQAFDGEKLGMAIMLPQSELTVYTAPEEGEGITQTFYTALPVTQQPLEFYFMAGWEKQDQQYATKKGFEQAVNSESEQLEVELIVE